MFYNDVSYNSLLFESFQGIQADFCGRSNSFFSHLHFISLHDM